MVNKLITLVLLLSRLSHLNHSRMAEPFRKSLIEIHSEIFLSVILFQNSPTFELRRFFLAQIQKANPKSSPDCAIGTSPKWCVYPPDMLGGFFHYTV